MVLWKRARNRIQAGIKPEKNQEETEMKKKQKQQTHRETRKKKWWNTSSIRNPSRPLVPPKQTENVEKNREKYLCRLKTHPRSEKKIHLPLHQKKPKKQTALVRVRALKSLAALADVEPTVLLKADVKARP